MWRCSGEGNGNPLQCSCLENPRERGAWWAAVYGVAQSWTWLKWLSSSGGEDVQHTLHEKRSLKNDMCGVISLYFFHIESEFNISGHTRDYQKKKKVLKKVRLESHRQEKGPVNYHMVYLQDWCHISPWVCTIFVYILRYFKKVKVINSYQ